MAMQFPIEKSFIPGAAGAIELATHIASQSEPRAIAVIAHPHPLFGGTMDNKVVTTLARAMFDCGAATYRFNFRGIGKSEGVHDDGRGETDDLLSVIAHTRLAYPQLPLWLAGFSFGGAVTLAASERIETNEMILVAPAFTRMSHWQNVVNGGRPPANTLLIHGEKDETVPLIDSFNWARTRDIAVTVVPEAAHFFHLRLHIIKRLVLQHLTMSSPD
jgi:uncharacterized protein